MRLAALAVAATASMLASPAVAARQPRIDVALIAETTAPRPGQTFLVGLKMDPQPGWHGYWSNPGGSGLAPVGKWRAPEGVRFGPLQHPAPSFFRAMGVTSYVHAGPHVLLARVRLDRGLRAGTVVPIIADFRWAACSDRLCVPEKARLSLRLKIGDGAPSGNAPLLRRALAKVPKPVAGGSYSMRDGRLVLQLPPSARLKASEARFFPDENGYWDPDGADVIRGRGIGIASPALGKPPKRITGVVTDGSSAYRVSLVPKR